MITLLPLQRLGSPSVPQHFLQRLQPHVNKRQNADAADTLLGEDTDGLIQNLKAIEETYGTDVLTLTVTCAYLDRLFSEEKITHYLERHHPGPLETLKTIISGMRSS